MANRIYVVGIGPGGREHMSCAARDIILNSQVVVGYKKYVELIEDLTKGKEVFSTPMMGEIKRCQAAIEFAKKGRDTAVVCSGDSGIYALAGLIFELLEKEGLLSQIDVEVIPGIPAFVACAAKLGAPLMHDFASVSLSDLMTPWETIEKRLIACGEGDFVTVIYNPRSKNRRWQLKEAIGILKRFRRDDTPVGIVRNVTREGEKIVLTTLGGMKFEDIDMFTLVIIGNSMTRKIHKYMVTPRGYLEKYEKL